MRRVIFLLLAGLFVLASCGGGGSAGGQRATVDGLTISFETAQPPKLLDKAELVVRLTDASGNPVDGADVYLDMSMASMPMGSNKPIAQGEGGGVYRASGAFDMVGDWTVTVHATVGGKEHKASFNTAVAGKG